MSFRLQLITVLRVIVQLLPLMEERKALIAGREGEGGGGGVRDGFLEYGMRQTEEKEERLDSHFKDEQWGLFSLVI